MAGRDWSEVVEEAVRRHVDSTGDPVFTRQELIDAELNRIVSENGLGRRNAAHDAEPRASAAARCRYAGVCR